MRDRWPWMVISGILLVGLLISVALNVVLYPRSRLDYVTLNAVRLNPLGLHTFDQASGWATDECVKVLFFGDLRAADWP
jgi:hypothetical protein